MAGLAESVKGTEVVNMAENYAKMVGILFMSRTYSHMAHLRTGSFATHKALNDFYDDILEVTDKFAETTQGLYGRLDVPYINLMGKVEEPIGALTSHLKALEKLCGDECGEEYLENILQEIQAIYRQTLYKLINLS